MLGRTGPYGGCQTECVVCIRADDSSGNVSIVSREEDGDGLNNERELSGRRREERTAGN